VVKAADQKGRATRKPQPDREAVVRTAKAIPRIANKPAPAPVVPTMPAASEATMELPCSGRCGHCDYHPCRLHGPI
jgi:hypothetical protein